MASLSHRHIYSASTAFGDSLGSSYGGFGSGDAMPRYDTGAGEHTPSFLSETARLLSSERRETYGPSSAYLYSTPPPSSQIAGWDSSLSSRLQLSSTGFKRPNEEALYPSDILSKRPRVDSISNIPAYPQRPGEKECLYYMKTRTCSFGENCKFDHPTWVPAGGIPDWKEVSVLTLTNDSLPVRPGEPECMFYMKTGACKFGLRCKFHHPKNRSSTGTAKGEIELNGTLSTDTSTKTEAPKSGQAVDGGIVDETKNAPPKPVSSYNSKGLPIRLGEAECAFYLKTGSCKFGSTCRFTHPENNPVTALRAQQLLPLLGGLSGIAGNPVTLPGVNAALADYGVGLSGIRIPGAAVQSLSLPTYPQRPGEKECVFYMKTGNCKFGLECKFHHPLSRVNPSYVDPGVKLSLAGLPRREGEAACAYYMKTGACKYGSNCRYDHPPPGEAAAKALTEASKTGQENPSDN